MAKSLFYACLRQLYRSALVKSVSAASLGVTVLLCGIIFGWRPLCVLVSSVTCSCCAFSLLMGQKMSATTNLSERVVALPLARWQNLVCH